MRNTCIALMAFLLTLSSLTAEESGKHLFILSGQSNMQSHKPNEAFTPAIVKEFGKDNAIIVQDAQGGQPLCRWDKTWKSPKGEKPKQSGELHYSAEGYKTLGKRFAAKSIELIKKSD